MLTDIPPAKLLAAAVERPAAMAVGNGLRLTPQQSTVRVLHVINGEHYAGAERVQDLLAAALPRWGFEVGFACLKPGRFPDLRRCREAPLYRVPMRGRMDLLAALRVGRWVRQGGYQLIHTHTPRSALVGRLAAGLARVPMVAHVHSPAAEDTTHRLRNRINQQVERWSLAGAARVVAVSRSLARRLAAAGLPPAKLRAVPNGVPVPAKRRCDRPPAGIWTLGTVALFRPRKGLEVLLEALAVLSRQNLPVRLRAVGPFETPNYEADVKRRADRLGIAHLIQWTGFQTDVESQFQAMDLFVLPSLFGEGLPMVLLEAMACGLPAVVARVEGVPEAVRDGREGLLVRPGQPGELASAVARIVRGEVRWGELRRGALARHQALFSDKAMAAGVAAVYRELLR